MLPPTARLRQRDEFTAVFRRGRRVARGAVVVHLLQSSAPSAIPATADRGGLGAGPRVGLVVGRSVGAAVRRNEVSRRLRHLMRPRLALLPASADIVVRALPSAAGRSSSDLGADLDAALTRLLRPSVSPA